MKKDEKRVDEPEKMAYNRKIGLIFKDFLDFRRRKPDMEMWAAVAMMALSVYSTMQAQKAGESSSKAIMAAQNAAMAQQQAAYQQQMESMQAMQASQAQMQQSALDNQSAMMASQMRMQESQYENQMALLNEQKAATEYANAQTAEDRKKAELSERMSTADRNRARTNRKNTLLASMLGQDEDEPTLGRGTILGKA